ncbi:MAG: UMP kinase [Candidatus Komeilibacteria bacterium]|nr:UMP kinase [Candidatus Komeilibacteria bacterium]
MKQVVLKITGEAFSNNGQGLNQAAVARLAASIQAVVKLGYRLGVVNGGGNLVRGRNAKNLPDHLRLDYLGLAATVKNGVALEAALRKLGVKAKLLVAVPYGKYSVFDGKRAGEYLKKYQVVIIAGGTGLPFFSTDTAAVLRALQLGVTTIWKASNVDGVYSADPDKNPKAKLLPRLTLDSAIDNRYAVVDQTALALSLEHKVSWRIFKYQAENLVAIAKGKSIGSLIK